MINGLIDGRRQAVGYVIPNRRFPLTLLESFREECADDEICKLAGFAHEALALVIGFIRSNIFQEAAVEIDSSVPTTLCLVMTYDEDDIDVVCFDYYRTAPANHRILIRDFFNTTCAGLAESLRGSDWLGEPSVLFSLETPSLPENQQALLNTTLDAVSLNLWNRRCSALDAHELKIEGCAYIARCSVGRGEIANQYIIETSYQIGMQINQKQFHPVLTKEELSAVKEFPQTFRRAFKLKGKAGNEMRISFYSGYVGWINDSTPLGQLRLSKNELTILSRNASAALLVSVTLDAPGSGQCRLELLPGKRLIGDLPFRLSGLVV
jgi:hypothetical protein